MPENLKPVIMTFSGEDGTKKKVSFQPLDKEDQALLHALASLDEPEDPDARS